MSTYYFLACDTHREQCPALTRTSGIGMLAGSEETMRPFLYAHRDCALRLHSEHDPRADQYDEWTPEDAAR